jgi:hypothetical protein
MIANPDAWALARPAKAVLEGQPYRQSACRVWPLNFSPLRPDAGLQPDLEVTETIEDITEGRDRVLEVASRA